MAEELSRSQLRYRGSLDLPIPEDGENLRYFPGGSYANPKFWVVLDTNQLLTDFKFDQPEGHLLLQMVHLAGGAFCFPEVVLAEHERHYKRELDKIATSLRSLRRLVSNVPSETVAFIEELRHYGGYLKFQLWEFRPLIYDYPEVPHATVVKRMFEGRKPFRSDTDKPEIGYRDFLLWCSIVALLLADSKARVFFVSANQKDFQAGASTQELAPDLLADLNSYQMDSSRLKFLRTRGDLRREIAAMLPPATAGFVEADPMWYLRFRDTTLVQAINEVWNATPRHREGEPGPRIWDIRDPSFVVDCVKQKLCGTIVEGTANYEWDWHYGDPSKRHSDNGDYSSVRALLSSAREVRWVEIDGKKARGPFEIGRGQAGKELQDDRVS